MKNVKISSPLNGKLVPLNEIDDPVFGSGAMGRGVAIKDPEGKVYAPFDGEITVFFPTKHAIGLKSNDGLELLIHVGMDTVKLNGQHFNDKAKVGDKIKKGQVLLEFDPDAIKKAGYQTTTPIVVTNHTEFGDITFELKGQPSILLKGEGGGSDAPAASGGSKVSATSSSSVTMNKSMIRLSFMIPNSFNLVNIRINY